jgi:hypothetical protein
MKRSSPLKLLLPGVWLLILIFAIPGHLCRASAIFTQEIDPPKAHVGDQVVITITVQNDTLGQVRPPEVDGLPVTGTRAQLQSTDDNGASSISFSFKFAVTPSRAGNFTIPAFDIRTQKGDMLHIKAMKLLVLGNGDTSSTNTAAATVPGPDAASNSSASAPSNSHGPVVMPPTNATPADQNASDAGDSGIQAPRDPAGGPAKVFMIITPNTTDAYVGQAVPMQIDFYIRMEVNADQNSLPTIKGSDFLMNNFMVRGHETVGLLEGMQYECETWRTAISSPKSGDFPLSMERDAYWVKSVTTTSGSDPFGALFNQRPNLAHELIPSNKLIIHVHPLPSEGRPSNFSGAIGQFKVSGNAQPDSVAVGEPVALRFTVSGEGNFDYVRCPTLTDDPAWKPYVPQSHTSYLEESHTRASKAFYQSVIPQKNGNLPLPSASFSYFDPTAKQYVTVPIALPTITVTGSPVSASQTSPDNGTDASAVPKEIKPTEFVSNRSEIGMLRTNLKPVYRQPWFWSLQAVLLLLPLIGALFLFIRSRSVPDNAEAERSLRLHSMQQEEEAMTQAANRGDAVAFFLASRHAIQLQLGARWGLKPEALTLAEIRQRDPILAKTLEPLFTLANEVIYSGHARRDLDLKQWDHRVRTELLQT